MSEPGEPFFVDEVVYGYGVFCIATESGEPDEMTAGFSPLDRGYASAICSMLNAAYGAGFEAGLRHERTST